MRQLRLAMAVVGLNRVIDLDKSKIKQDQSSAIRLACIYIFMAGFVRQGGAKTFDAS
jgi:hypothetical protein